MNGVLVKRIKCLNEYLYRAHTQTYKKAPGRMRLFKLNVRRTYEMVKTIGTINDYQLRID